MNIVGNRVQVALKSKVSSESAKFSCVVSLVLLHDCFTIGYQNLTRSSSSCTDSFLQLLQDACLVSWYESLVSGEGANLHVLLSSAVNLHLFTTQKEINIQKNKKQNKAKTLICYYTKAVFN